MLTGVERVSIGVGDLAHAVRTFSSLGFELHRRTDGQSALAFNGDDSLELVAVGEGETEGLRSIAIESDDLASDVAAVGSAQRGN